MGAGTLKRGSRAPIAEINITPMVDVVLVLLVIMMVSATYIVSKSLKVELPKAASGGESVPSIATVMVTKDGKYFFNQDPVDDAALSAKLKEAHEQNPDISLIVSADKGALHGNVVHVVDVARLNDITKFAINVDETK
ncbi:ExbD/TolR family protein [Pendulispora albinea]|uniref:Biopolymer transporter ExbD n=1 Tax=Pendulispora albinea TaxID=2741071 RepID=A0ABZ2LK37_9BACT